MNALGEVMDNEMFECPLHRIIRRYAALETAQPRTAALLHRQIVRLWQEVYVPRRLLCAANKVYD